MAVTTNHIDLGFHLGLRKLAGLRSVAPSIEHYDADIGSLSYAINLGAEFNVWGCELAASGSDCLKIEFNANPSSTSSTWIVIKDLVSNTSFTEVSSPNYSFLASPAIDTISTVRDFTDSSYGFESNVYPTSNSDHWVKLNESSHAVILFENFHRSFTFLKEGYYRISFNQTSSSMYLNGTQDLDALPYDQQRQFKFPWKPVDKTILEYSDLMFDSLVVKVVYKFDVINQLAYERKELFINIDFNKTNTVVGLTIDTDSNSCLRPGLIVKSKKYSPPTTACSGYGYLLDADTALNTNTTLLDKNISVIQNTVTKNFRNKKFSGISFIGPGDFVKHSIPEVGSTYCSSIIDMRNSSFFDCKFDNITFGGDSGSQLILDGSLFCRCNFVNCRFFISPKNIRFTACDVYNSMVSSGFLMFYGSYGNNFTGMRIRNTNRPFVFLNDKNNNYSNIISFTNASLSSSYCFNYPFISVLSTSLTTYSFSGNIFLRNHVDSCSGDSVFITKVNAHGNLFCGNYFFSSGSISLSEKIKDKNNGIEEVLYPKVESAAIPLWPRISDINPFAQTFDETFLNIIPNDSVPTARWSCVPMQWAHNGDSVLASIVAYHSSGIRKVVFILDGGETFDGAHVFSVSKPVTNPITHQDEYSCMIDVSNSMSEGIHTVRAIIYPNTGSPRVLQGTWLPQSGSAHPYPENGEVDFTFIVNRGSHDGKSVYVDINNGNDTSGNGSYSNPFKNLWKAINHIHQGVPNGSIKEDFIWCKEGSYRLSPIIQADWPSAPLGSNLGFNRIGWLTIQPYYNAVSDSVVITNKHFGFGSVSSGSTSAVPNDVYTRFLCFKNIVIENYYLSSDGLLGDKKNIFVPKLENIGMWIDRSRISCRSKKTISDIYQTLSSQTNSDFKAYPEISEGIVGFITGSIVKDLYFGLRNFVLVSNSGIGNTLSGALTGCPCILSCKISGVGILSQPPGCSVIKISKTSLYKNNILISKNTIKDCEISSFEIGGESSLIMPRLENVAIVSNYFTNKSSSKNSYIYNCIKYLFINHNSFFDTLVIQENTTYSWASLNISNVSIENNLIESLRTGSDYTSEIDVADSRDLDDTAQYFSRIAFNGGIQDQREWNSWSNNTIAIFSGDRITENNSSESIARPYGLFELDPVSPEVSSPWHNLVYELAYPIYKWGNRSFHFQFPFGGSRNDMESLEEKSGYDSPIAGYIRLKEKYPTGGNYTSDFACPSRWRGMKEAFNALLRGKLTPTSPGYEAMTEPSNIVLYLPCFMGYPTYREETCGYWDNLPGEPAQKDAQFYAILDQYIADLVYIKENGIEIKGTLYIGFDSLANSATPDSIELYRAIPNQATGSTNPNGALAEFGYKASDPSNWPEVSNGGYRSDKLELADWYVKTKLEAAGIIVSQEAIPPSTSKQIQIEGRSGKYHGSINERQIIHTLYKNFTAVEGTMWASRSYSAPFDLFDDILRWPSNSFEEVQVLLGGNPFNQPLQVQIQNGSQLVTRECNGMSGLVYSPFYYLHTLNAVIDHIKYVDKTIAQDTNKTDIKLNHKNIIVLPTGIFASNLDEPYANNSTADITKYYVHPGTSGNAALELRPALDKQSFINNSDDYTGGLWTTANKDYWDINLRSTSFTNFMENIRAKSKLVSPPKEIFDTGITLANGFTFEQTYPYDSISKGILSGIYEPEPRSQIYALSWISTKGNVADWSDGGVDITPVTDFTHIKPMVAIKGSYGFTPSPINGGNLNAWMSEGAGWQIPIIRNQLRVLENNNNLANTNIKSIRTIYYDQSWLFGHDPFVSDPALQTNPIDYYNPIVTSNVKTILYPDREMELFIKDWVDLLKRLDEDKTNPDGLLIRNTRLVGDSETILASGNFQLNEPYFNALKLDSRFIENKYGVDSLKKQLADDGINDIQWSPYLCPNANSCGYPFPNGEQYLIWNKAVSSITTAVLNKVLWEPFVERYKNIPGTTPTGTNYDTSISNFRDGYPDSNGHEVYYDNLFGTSVNVHLFGRMVPSLQAWTIDTASPTHLRRRLSDSDIIFNCWNNPWYAFLFTVQSTRACKRGSISKGITTGTTPWIALKNWGGDLAGIPGFVNNSYYDEAIRHEALTGVEVFQIFNSSFLGTDPASIQVRKEQFTIINDILVDINDKLGGYTPTTLDDSRVSYNSTYVMSGAPTVNGKYLWRVTPKVSTDTIYSNGVLAPKIGSQIGVWITTTTSIKPNIFLQPFSSSSSSSSSSGSSGSSSSSGSDVTYNIYVNGSTGDDSGNGINPVKTIFKAVNLAKAYIDRGGTQNIEIRIHGGTYNMLGTDTKPILYLNSAYNPNGESTLTFKPATQSDEVIISGSDEITWDQFSLIPQDDPNRNLIPSNARENVYVASLSSYDIGPGYPTNWAADGIGSAVGKVYDLPTLPDLIFNDVLMTVARWPNKTTLTSSGIAMEESALIESVVDSGTNSTWTVDRQWLGWNDTTTSDPCEQSAVEDPSPCFRNGTFEYPEEYHSTITKWTSNALAKGIFIKGWWRFDWHSETYKVTAINLSARTITVESKKSNYGIQDYRICNPDTGVLDSTLDSSFKSNTTKRRWFALNILEELDSPGEYYIDRATKKLYFWPPTQINPQSRISLTHRAVAGAGIKENNQLEVGFATNGSISRENYAYPGWSSEAIFGYSLSGSSEHSRMVYNTRYALKSLFKLNQVKNVIIEGLTFRNSAGSGIELRQCENVIVRNCKIYNINKHGIDAPGGKNVIIDTCTLHDIGLSAIINTGGNRQTLEPSNKLITKCSIKRWGKHESGLKLAAISIHGVGNTVSSNLISDGSTAIYFTYGNNITIEYNHFHNLAKHQDDTGAIYGGRNVSGFDVKIKNNFFNNVGTKLDGGPRYEGADLAGDPDVGCPGNIDNNQVVGSHAVYFDDFSCGNSVEGNVFYKCGTRDNTDAVFYNGGIKNEAKNNIFIDCNTAMSDVKTTIDNFNTVLAAQQFSGLNTQNYPWYENGGPGNYTDLTTLNSATGYSPWTWYFSPTAYPEDRYKGLMQVVDIRTGTYKDAAPWLHSLYQFSNPTPGTFSTLTVNPAKVLENRNKQINNVFVNCEKRYKSYLVGDASFPGKTFITGEVEGNTNFFVNYANNNFRLTPSALQSIRNQQSSDFQEIPWDLIPTINR